MATRKAPTGAKHDRCIGHVEHSYPAKGMLCFGEVIGGDGMVAFADHLAETRAAHRAADLAEREAMHTAPVESWYIGSGETRELRRKQVDEIRGMPVMARTACDGSSCHENSVHAHSVGAHLRTTPADAAALAELVARYRTMRGLDVPAAPVRMPVERIGRASISKRAAARRDAGPIERPEPVQAAPVVEPAPVELCPAEAMGYQTCTRPAGHGGKHDGPAPMLPAQRCRSYARGATINDYTDCSLIEGHNGVHVFPAPIAETVARCGRTDAHGAHVFPAGVGPDGRTDGTVRDAFCAGNVNVIVAAPDTYAAAVELAETRPDPCAECAHPSHGATCAICDEAAQLGQYAPCQVTAPDALPSGGAEGYAVEPAPSAPHEHAAGWCAHGAGPCQHETDCPHTEPIAAPAPVLSAPSAIPSRPSCERCGQVFRAKGSGAEWHRVNRPDCARVAVAIK